MLRLYWVVHVAMETTKTSHFTCQSISFICIFFTCQASACELQPFSCHDLADDIYSQSAKTVFSYHNSGPEVKNKQYTLSNDTCYIRDIPPDLCVCCSHLLVKHSSFCLVLFHFFFFLAWLRYFYVTFHVNVALWSNFFLHKKKWFIHLLFILLKCQVGFSFSFLQARSKKNLICSFLQLGRRDFWCPWR